MKRSIKTRFISLFFILIGIPLTLLGVLSYEITAKSVHNIIEQQIRTLEDKTSKSIEEKTNAVSKYTQLLAYDEEIAKSALNKDENLKRECFEYISKLQENNKDELEGIWIVDLNSKIVLTNNDLNPNVDLSDRDYIKKALSGVPAKSDVVLSKVTANPIVSVAYPLRVDNKIVGAIVGVINFEKISKYVSEISIGKKGYAYLLDKNGVIIYHPDKEKIFKENLFNTDNKELKSLINNLKAENTSEGYYNKNGKKFTRFVKVNDWILCVAVDYNEYMYPALYIRKITIFLCIAFILIATISAYILINKNLITPFLSIKSLMQRAENGDLTVKAAINTKDELEDLAHSFNRMIQRQREIVTNIGGHTEQLTASSQELAASSEEINASSQDIIKSIQKISEDFDMQNNSIVNTSEVLVQLSSRVNLAQKKAIVTKENSDETMSTANNGRIKVKETVEAINSISVSAEETAHVLSVLQELSKKVEGIINTINDISDQTNLLALNASIEAARAGEHGKGFSVVAEEVRKLSEASNMGANQISTLVKEMVKEINSAVKSMDNNKKVIERGVIIANDTDDAFITIIRSVEQMVGDINKIVEITEDEVASSEQIIKLIDTVASTSENTAASNEEIAAASEQQCAAIENLTYTSQECSNMAIDLNNLIDKFKV